MTKKYINKNIKSIKKYYLHIIKYKTNQNFLIKTDFNPNFITSKYFMERTKKKNYLQKLLFIVY